MTAAAITVTNLSKAYKRYPSKWARLTEWTTGKDHHHKNWVLRDVSFEVAPGEAVGVIGANGAGKSTLLKIITGTTRPTVGSVHVRGRIAALLELGMGFHPDFSGRQNVFMAGQMQGLALADLKEQFEKIAAFADIGDHIDQPVRIYSSGMQVRLAFAVATAIRPDVLIVDEALAVGDAAFQRKCHRRIESFLEKGTALLFVSHDIEGVKKLCEKAIYLGNGLLLAVGAAKPVCDQYETMLFGGSHCIEEARADGSSGEQEKQNNLIDPSPIATDEVTYGDGRANIERVWIENSAGKKVNVLVSGETFSVCYVVNVLDNVGELVVAMLIKTLEGVALYGSDSMSLKQRICQVKANSRYAIRFRMTCHLASGTYFLNCGIRDDKDAGHFLHRRVDVLMFKVTKDRDFGQAGLVNLAASLIVENA